MSAILKAWNGEEKLWKIFWFYNFLLGTALSILLESIPVDQLLLILSVYAASIVWGIWVFVSLWKCAFNTSWRGWGYISRAIVVLGILTLPVSIYSALVG